MTQAEAAFLDIKNNSGRVCSCGKTHEILVKELRVHSGALGELPEVIANCGDYHRIVMVCDENTYEAAGKQVESIVSLAGKVILSPDHLHANEKGVAILSEKMPEHYDLLLAVGSGTIHDLTRYTAYHHDVPFISVPTACSVDGFVTPVCAMTWNGIKLTMTAVAPMAMVADCDILAKAPKKLNAAGVGDMLGKYTAIFDWKVGRVLTGEYYCEEIEALEMKALREIEENIDGIASGSPDAMEKLMYGLVLSGLAMQMAGNSRPASGAEHHISHIIEMGVFGENESFHGEKVGVATALVCERYHSLLKKSFEELHFSQDGFVADEELAREFGTLTEEIRKENQKIDMTVMTSELLKAHWSEIQELASMLPTGDVIVDELKRCGGSTTLSDLHLESSLEPKLHRLSPMVRARWTLNRVATGFQG